MFKAAPTYVDGQSLVLLSDLPEKQNASLERWVGSNNLVSINVDGHYTHTCVKYEDYETWYRNYFRIDNDSIL